MAEDQSKIDDEQSGFTREGEAIRYIDLDQAQILAMQIATENPGDYGDAYAGVSMAFEVARHQETEDHYIITLSVRPQGDFAGKPGREQFVIEKEGKVTLRQVLALPRPPRPVPVLPIAIGVVVAGVVAVIAVLAVAGLGRGDDGQPAVASLPTATPIPTTQTPFPAPTKAQAVVSPSDATPRPAATPKPVPTTAPPRPADKIAFSSERDGNREIYTMNADGSDQTRLTFDVAHSDSPAWSTT